MLREHMERDSEYEAAMRYWLAREPTALRQPGERLPTREVLYSERTDWPRSDREK